MARSPQITFKKACDGLPGVSARSSRGADDHNGRDSLVVRISTLRTIAMNRVLLPCLFACLLLPAVAHSGERWTIGLSTSGAPIEAVTIAGPSTSSPTVLLVGGLERTDQSSEAVDREAATFEQIPQQQRAFRLIPTAP